MYPTTDLERKADIRDDGNFVGGVVLLVTALLSLGFTVIVLVLVALGKLTPDNLQQDDLGLGNTGYLLLYMCTYIAFMGIPPFAVCLLFRRLPRIQTPVAPLQISDRLLAFFIGLGGCAVANVITSYVAAFLESYGISQPESPVFMDKTPQSFLLNLVVSALLPAVLEELAFRKCVLGALQKYGQGLAVFVSALLFGIMHGGIAQSVFAFIVGLALGFITVKTGNIRIAVAVHFVNNALSITAEYLTLGLEQTAQGAAYAAVIGITAVCGIVALIVSAVQKSVLFAKAPRVAPQGGVLGTLWGAPLMVIATILLILRVCYTNLM